MPLAKVAAATATLAAVFIAASQQRECHAFQPAVPLSAPRSRSSLSMVLEKPKQKKLAKIEELKVASDHLLHPLREVRPSGHSSSPFASRIKSRRKRAPERLPTTKYDRHKRTTEVMEYHSFPVRSIHADDLKGPVP